MQSNKSHLLNTVKEALQERKELTDEELEEVFGGFGSLESEYLNQMRWRRKRFFDFLKKRLF